MSDIHSTAVIHPKAKVGDHVTVGPFAVIGEHAEVGDGCMIDAHAAVVGHTTIGEGSHIYSGAVIGGEPQDLAYKGDVSHVKVGKRCTLRECVTINRGTKPGTVTEIGDDCFLMATVHVGHNCKLGKRVIIANGTMLGGYVEVGDFAFISGAVTIHQFVKIGRLVMVGGAAGLSKDVPPFCLVQSMGRNIVAGLNVVGLRRSGFTPAERKVVKDAFKTLYLSGQNVSQAVAQMKGLFTEGPAAELAVFVEQAHRGICRFAVGEEAETE
jgi:UDP-N-acetylglucosamine acyltransferase